VLPHTAHAVAAAQFVVGTNPQLLFQADLLRQHTAQARSFGGDVGKAGRHTPALHADWHGRHAGLDVGKTQRAHDSCGMGLKRFGPSFSFPLPLPFHAKDISMKPNAQQHAAAEPAGPTPPSRRRAIQLVGGGLVLASTGGLAACASSAPEATVQAWQPGFAKAKATSHGNDVRHFMLAHALLAPNPHNRQPWLADLRRGGEISLVCDKDRLLPQTDPFGRQILVGCGAFIELAVMAATERGQRVDIVPFPQGEPPARALPGGSVVATLRVQADSSVKPDALFAQIHRRRTNKGNYDNARVVPANVWRDLAAVPRQMGLQGLLAGQVTDAAQLTQLRQITRSSYDIEMTTARTWLESAHLLRIGPDEIAQHRDGISVMGTLPRLLNSLGMFDRFAIPVRGDSNHTRLMERWAPFETGSGYHWIASQGNSRRQQLDAGRAYARAQLLATAAGLSLHPVSQALQEYAEVAPLYQDMHRLLGFDAKETTLQMLVRVGYPLAPVGPSPRRELAQIISA
jgi:Nitroreductase family